MVGGMCGRGCVWQGACLTGDVCGRGCAWQGACMAGACTAGGMQGKGACMAGGMHGGGGGHAWQERWLLQRTVGILLVCIPVLYHFPISFNNFSYSAFGLSGSIWSILLLTFLITTVN